MLKRLARDAVVYGASTVLVRGISFLLIPLYAYALDPAAYGIIELAAIAAALVHVTVALEISQGFGRAAADLPGREERRAYAATAFWSTTASYGLFLAAAALAAAPAAEALFEGHVSAGQFRLLVLGMSLNGILYLVLSQLRWTFRPAAFAVASVVASAGVAGAIAWFVLVQERGLTGVFAGQVVGFAIGMAVALAMARRDLPFRFDARKWREMVAFSLPLVPSGIAVFLLVSADRLVIQRFLSFDDLGIYAVAFRLGTAVSLVLAGVQLAAGPLVLSDVRTAGAPQRLARVVRWAVAGGLALAVAMGAFAPELVDVIAPPEYGPAAGLVPWLVLAALLAQAHVFFPGLVVQRRTGAFALVTGAAAAVGVAASLVLVPRFGLPGAVAGACSGAVASAVGHAVASQRTYLVPHAWGSVALSALLALVSLLAVRWFWGGVANGLALAAKGMFVAAAVALVAAAALGVTELRVIAARRRPAVARSAAEEAA